MPELNEQPIIELGKNPIPGPAACGVDAAEDEQYIFIQGEVGKLDRIETGEPDWYGLEQAATNILRSKAKDIEVAAYLGFALFKRYGYAGLAASLAMLTEMVNTFWDGAFPERPRRRKARIETLTDRFADGGWFRDRAPKPDEFDAVDLCVTRIDELNNALKAKMPDDPADFTKFVRGIKELAGRRPKPATAGAAPAGAEGGAPAAAPAAGGASLPAAEISDVSGAINQLLSAATFIRKAEPTHPVPYAVVRAIKWSRIALPTTPAAKFEIEPPEATKLDALTHQMNNGLWENLLKNAEAAFRSSDPLWLDLQRYVCSAMSGLGSGYEKARQTVIAMTASLVNRLGEGLFELRFKNGTPLCSGETKMWIESEAAPVGGKGGRSASGAVDGKLAEASDEARKLAGAGKLKEALAALQDGLGMCSQRRDRFLWRLTIARLCFEAGRQQLAAPLLEECREEIRRYHIQEWEPGLASQVAETLYKCRKALLSTQKEPAPEAVEHVRDSFAWLCQLDPLGALSAEPTGN